MIKKLCVKKLLLLGKAPIVRFDGILKKKGVSYELDFLPKDVVGNEYY